MIQIGRCTRSRLGDRAYTLGPLPGRYASGGDGAGRPEVLRQRKHSVIVSPGCEGTDDLTDGWRRKADIVAMRLDEALPYIQEQKEVRNEVWCDGLRAGKAVDGGV